MSNYAIVERKFSPLGTDFAREFVARRFGPAVAAAIYAALPIKSRGRFKGEPKGYVRWLKCSKGGWYRTGPNYYGEPGTNGYVMRPGSNKVEIVVGLDQEGAGLGEGFWREEDSEEQRVSIAAEAIKGMFEREAARAKRGWR